VRETHQRAKFVELSAIEPDKLAVGSYGQAGTGKTEFITSALEIGNVGVIPLDRKTRRTLSKSQEKYSSFGNKIFFPPEDFIRHAKPMELALMNEEAAKKYYSDHIARIEDALFTLAERKDIAVIAIDSGTQLWEDILFKHYGRAQRIMPRDRGPANQDMRDLLNSLQHKHLIITHQATEVWKNDKPSGKFEWSGWSKMDYYVNTIIEHTYDEKKNEYGLTVRLCQDRPDLIGEEIATDENITFATLGNMIYPDGDFA
jgi:hypothetical protein